MNKVVKPHEAKFFVYPQDCLQNPLPRDGSAKGSMYIHPSDAEAVFSDDEVSVRVAEYMFVQFLRAFNVEVARTKRAGKPPVVLYIPSDVEHLMRANVLPSEHVGFKDFASTPETLHRQITEKLLRTGSRDLWWEKDMHPILHRHLSQQELAFLRQGGSLQELHINLCDIDFVAGWIAGLGHFRSFFMANPGNIGANAKGIAGCRHTGLGQFALVVGDSMVHGGDVSVLAGDAVSQRVLQPLVREACMAWNYRAGLLGTCEGCVRHIDYTDGDLVKGIVSQNLIGLKCHRQVGMMCAFQASLHFQAVLQRILQDFRRGVEVSHRWPAGENIGQVGLPPTKALTYRQGIGEQLRAIMHGTF